MKGQRGNSVVPHTLCVMQRLRRMLAFQKMNKEVFTIGIVLLSTMWVLIVICKKKRKKRWSDWHDGVQFTGSVIEIIYGAIFQDSGFSLEHTQRIFDNHVVPFIEKYCKGPSASDLHPKGLLTRWMQAKGCAYWKLDAVGPKLCEGVGECVFLGGGGDFIWKLKNNVIVTCHDQDVARCKAFTTHVAVRNVCEEAIKRLRNENRIKDICDCPSFKEVVPEDKMFRRTRW